MKINVGVLLIVGRVLNVASLVIFVYGFLLAVRVLCKVIRTR